MQFLRTLFWVVLAVCAVAFSYNNWHYVEVLLWSGIVVQIYLPLLIFGAFLLGLLPPYLWHRATRWRMRRRLDTAERALAEARGVPDPVTAAIEPAPAVVPPPIAPQPGPMSGPTP